jgi:gliding motility-associated-like protein
LGSLTNCSNGCPTITISTSNIVDDSCFGQTIGSFNASTSGGVSPYSYTLKNSSGTIVAGFNNIAGTQPFTGLPAGVYTLHVLDNNDCPGITTITITQPSAAATIAAAGPDQSICSSSTVLAGNTATVGTGMWTLVSGTGTLTNPSSPTSGVTGLGIGTTVFQWTINDSPCSSTSDQVTITNTGGGPTVTITSHTNVHCYGGNNGSATASATGSGNLTYAWAASGGNAATANNLTAGTYTVTVTDASGCFGIATVAITQPLDSISAHVTTTPTPCGLTNGSATVTASGGTGSLTYVWNNGGATTSTINNIGAGTHTVIITDSLGCTKTVSGTVAINGGGPIVTITSHTNVSCYGEHTGSATASATGGIGNLTYAWAASGGNNLTANNLAIGTYTITATDGSGCTGTATVAIIQPDSISAHVNTTPTACTITNGSATASASGGKGNFTYSWVGGATTTTINNIAAGTYSVTVTDSSGCTKTVSGIVATTGNPIANAGTDVTISSDSTTHLSATGGGTYVWSPATGLSCTNCQSPVASPKVTTTYYVMVTDSNGCTNTDSVKVTVILAEHYFIPNIFSPNNDAINDFFEIREEGFKTYHVEIFDRWGIKMFETSDSHVYWNGLTMGGAKASDGVYFYILTLTDFKDQSKTLRGFLSLVR